MCVHSKIHMYLSNLPTGDHFRSLHVHGNIIHIIFANQNVSCIECLMWSLRYPCLVAPTLAIVCREPDVKVEQLSFHKPQLHAKRLNGLCVGRHCIQYVKQTSCKSNFSQQANYHKQIIIKNGSERVNIGLGICHVDSFKPC